MANAASPPEMLTDSLAQGKFADELVQYSSHSMAAFGNPFGICLGNAGLHFDPTRGYF